MKVLVIGGNGFIGSRLVQALQGRGDEVTVLDRSMPRDDLRLLQVQYLQARFDDEVVLDEALQGVDQVFHLASCSVPSTADADPVGDVEGNLLGTLSMLKRMKANGVRRICYFSSGGTVYGNPTALPVPEEHPLEPISSYGIVKVAIERYLQMFHRQGWLDPVVMRPSNPYGPGQSTSGTQGAVAVFLGRALADQDVQIWGDGGAIRDYVFIDDLIDLTLLAADSGQNGAFNAASGIGVSLNELCAMIRSCTGSPLVVEYKAGRSFDVRAIVLDVDRARRELNWVPRVTLEEGIRRTWQVLQQSGRAVM